MSEALPSSLEHHLSRCDLVVGPGWSRFHIDNHRILNIDQVIEPVAKLHALVGLGCPSRARINRRDHLRQLSVSMRVIVLKSAEEFGNSTGLTLWQRPVDLVGCRWRGSDRDG